MKTPADVYSTGVRNTLLAMAPMSFGAAERLTW